MKSNLHSILFLEQKLPICFLKSKSNKEVLSSPYYSKYAGSVVGVGKGIQEQSYTCK